MRRCPLTLRLARVDLLRVLEKHSAVMASENKLASTPPAQEKGEILLNGSYGEVAKAIGRSKPHVFLVCKRRRVSAELERKLQPYVIGIGKN